ETPSEVETPREVETPSEVETPREVKSSSQNEQIQQGTSINNQIKTSISHHTVDEKQVETKTKTQKSLPQTSDKKSNLFIMSLGMLLSMLGLRLKLK
uniref:hypothetical protein n=2 Tax=Enterococcaceae TaxID=81852 RepID=UPI000E80E9EF